MPADKNSGVQDIPVPRCPVCHSRTYTTAAGRTIHLDPGAECRSL